MSIVPSIFGRRSSVYDPFTSDIWDPFSFDTWDPFSSLTSDFEPSRRLAQDASAVANTRIDWKETPEAHLFKADLPGLKKEEVKVEVEEGRILKISGERRKEEEQKTDKWHRIERSHGRFQRRFRLPDNAKVDELKATLENGVLTVTVPKQPEPKSEVKTIDIAGSG